MDINILNRLPYKVNNAKLDGIYKDANNNWHICYINQYGATQKSVTNESIEVAVTEMLDWIEPQKQ